MRQVEAWPQGCGLRYWRRAERQVLLESLDPDRRHRTALDRQAEHPALPPQWRSRRGQDPGQRRTAPVVYLRDGERLVVIGSNAGHSRTPAWSLNLKANPDAEVEVGRKRQQVRARAAEGEERSELWRKHNEVYSGFDEYEARTDRDIAVFVLEPAGA